MIVQVGPARPAAVTGVHPWSCRGATTVTVVDLDLPTASATVHLFPPNKDAYGKSENHPSAVGPKPILSPIPAGGSYGIVLELPGDKTAFSDCGESGCEGFPENYDPRKTGRMCRSKRFVVTYRATTSSLASSALR